jgi:uncharacterized protein
MTFTTPPVSDLSAMIRSMQPALRESCYVFTTANNADEVPLGKTVAMIREDEGVSLVMLETDAIAAHLPIHFRAAWITLKVHSDLQAVGLTAAFARALADVAISCNVIAGSYHDHIFVPFSEAQRALDTLNQLQNNT